MWHRGSLGDEDDTQASNACIVQRKHTVLHSTMKNNDCNIIVCCNNTHQGAPHTRTFIRSCKNVLCIQHHPEACTSDLGGNQSRYLFYSIVYLAFVETLPSAACKLLHHFYTVGLQQSRKVFVESRELLWSNPLSTKKPASRVALRLSWFASS